MMRFMGVLTGILLTTSLYFLYLNHNMRNADTAVGSGELSIEQTASISPDQIQPVLPPLSEEDVEIGVTAPTPDQLPPDLNSLGSAPVTSLQPQEVVFWQPFHSRYSATGFARRMTDATGVKIYVLPAERKQYRVAFNYLDENDRLSKISIIENITGLELDP